MGVFLGMVCVGGIYCGQWWVVGDWGYNMFGGYVDVFIIWGFCDQDWVGVGAYILQDCFGLICFMICFNGLFGVYYLGLDKKGEFVLMLGVQIGSIMWSLWFSDIFLGFNWDVSNGEFIEYGVGLVDLVIGIGGGIGGGGGNMDFNDNDIFNFYFDICVGLLFKQKIDDFDNFEVGVVFGYFNVLNYIFGVVGGGGMGLIFGLNLGGNNIESSDCQFMLIIIYVCYEWVLNNKWFVVFMVMW